MQTKMCKYGYMEGQNSTEGFVLSRVISTDPAAYLDPQFVPGSKLQIPL